MRIECVGTARPSPCIDVNGGLLAKHGAAWHGAVAVTMDAVVESRMTGRQGAGTDGELGEEAGLNVAAEGTRPATLDFCRRN